MNAGPISATAAANRAATRQLLRIVIVGHVDHGKSTLVGRLFHDTGSLPDGKFEAIRKMCERRGMPFEWAFLMDAMQAERDQGITIDTAQIWFKTEKRDYTIIDAPGHKEFLKNMITGAAQSDAAVLVIDATEGVQEQSRRHGYLLHLLGVRQIAVAVNKMDAVGYREDVFTKIEAEYRDYLASIGVTPTFVVPVSAREGDNIATRSQAMEWYDGPTVVGALDSFQLPATSVDRPLRFPIQDVYKFDDRRILAGRIESGRLHVGDELMFSPSNNTARVKSIEVWPEPSDPDARPKTVGAGQCIGITLDDQLFVERGEMASHTTNPPIETEVFRAKLFWLGRKPLEKGKVYKMKIGTGETRVTVQEIEHVLDTTDLSSSTTSKVERNQVGEVVLRSRRLLALDEHTRNGRTGRFVLIDGYDIAGGGIISMEGYADQRQLVTQRAKNITRVEHGVPTGERERQNGHKGGVLWFTGLSGAGKSTLATKLERALFDRGYQTYVLDGDNIRFGLNANLGFSPEERAENIRRVGEVAALFSRAGLVTITAFISPYQSDRERARKAAGEHFHEVYIKADLGTCEERDPKGLYAKARTGEIKDFTGISAPYEAPDTAELIIDTSNLSIDQALEELLGYVEKTFRS